MEKERKNKEKCCICKTEAKSLINGKFYCPRCYYNEKQKLKSKRNEGKGKGKYHRRKELEKQKIYK